MTGWTEPAGWRGACLDRVPARRLGLAATGPVEQPHVRPWATALRVPTTAGDVWFKAAIPVRRTRPAVVDVLSRRRPDLVPELLAADFDRGWMLMADGGTRLRELIEEERDLGRWLDVLPRYAELQVALAADADRLVAWAPRPPARLLPRSTRGSRTHAGRLRRDRPPRRRDVRADRLVGIPETIQHDDLHDAQIFDRDGQYLFSTGATRASRTRSSRCR